MQEQDATKGRNEYEKVRKDANVVSRENHGRVKND